MRFRIVLSLAALVGIASGVLSTTVTRTTSGNTSLSIQSAEAKKKKCANMPPGTVFRCDFGTEACRQFNIDICGARFTGCAQIEGQYLCVSNPNDPVLLPRPN